MPFLDPEVGCLTAGNDILEKPRRLTVEEAKFEAPSLPGCCGFTYEGAVDTKEPVTVYFKNAWHIEPHQQDWTSVQFLNFEGVDPTGPSHKRMVAFFDSDFFPFGFLDCHHGEYRDESSLLELCGGSGRVQLLADVLTRLVRLGVRCVVCSVVNPGFIALVLTTLGLQAPFVSRSGAPRVIQCDAAGSGIAVKAYLEARTVLPHDALFVTTSVEARKSLMEHCARIEICEANHAAETEVLQQIANHFKALRPPEGPYTLILFLRSLAAPSPKTYKEGDSVEYYSRTQNIWLHAKVTKVDSHGLEVDVKPGYQLQGIELCERVRPYRALEEPSKQSICIGDRVKLKYMEAWYDGTVHGLPADDETGKGCFKVHCDVDADGVMTKTPNVVLIQAVMQQTRDEPGRACPVGHSLEQFFVGDSPGIAQWRCDVCGAIAEVGSIMSGCRLCNYDMCESCCEQTAATYTVDLEKRSCDDDPSCAETVPCAQRTLSDASNRLSLGDEARVAMMISIFSTLTWMGVKLYVIAENNALWQQCQEQPELARYLSKPEHVYFNVDGSPGRDDDKARFSKSDLVSMIVKRSGDADSNILYVGCVSKDVDEIADRCKIATRYCDALTEKEACGILAHFQNRIYSMQSDYEQGGDW